MAKTSIYLALTALILIIMSSCKKSMQRDEDVVVTTPLIKLPGNDLIPWNEPVFTIDADGIKSAHFNRNFKQALYIPSDSSLQAGATDITLAGWVKMDSVSTLPQVIACKDNDSTSQGSEYYMGYYPPYGSFVFQVETLTSTTKYVISSLGKPVAGAWYYVVGSYDHINGKVYIEVNNSTKDSVTGVAGQTHVTNTAFTLGSDANSGAGVAGMPHGGFLNGSLASVSVWKRLLTPVEKLTLYIYDGLHVAQNAGTLHAGIWTADVPPVIQGNINAVSFNGTSSAVTSASDIVLGLRSSVSLWFKPTNLSGCLLGNNKTARRKYLYRITGCKHYSCPDRCYFNL